MDSDVYLKRSQQSSLHKISCLRRFAGYSYFRSRCH